MNGMSKEEIQAEVIKHKMLGTPFHVMFFTGLCWMELPPIAPIYTNVPTLILPYNASENRPYKIFQSVFSGEWAAPKIQRHNDIVDCVVDQTTKHLGKWKMWCQSFRINPSSFTNFQTFFSGIYYQGENRVDALVTSLHCTSTYIMSAMTYRTQYDGGLCYRPHTNIAFEELVNYEENIIGRTRRKNR